MDVKQHPPKVTVSFFQSDIRADAKSVENKDLETWGSIEVPGCRKVHCGKLLGALEARTPSLGGHRQQLASAGIDFDIPLTLTSPNLQFLYNRLVLLL